jgi:putative copper export protein
VNHDDVPITFDLYALGRGLAYGATILLIGCCVFAVLVPRWRDPLDDDQSLAARALASTWRLAGLAPIVLLLAHLLRGYAQVRSFLDPIEPFTWDAAQPILFATAWGKGWMAQLAAATISIPLAWFAPRRPAIGLSLLGTAALLVAVTSPLTGHAGEHPWGAAVGIGLHSLHILGAGLWLGTLACMTWAAIGPARFADGAAVARAVRVFSPVALIGAGLAVTAGVLLALAYIGNLTSLIGTNYGRVLLVKVGLLAVTAALGQWNWKKLTPRLGTPEATAQLRRSTAIELLFGLGILIATAILVSLPAPKL